MTISIRHKIRYKLSNIVPDAAKEIFGKFQINIIGTV
jgi:hypothetical protein